MMKFHNKKTRRFAKNGKKRKAGRSPSSFSSYPDCLIMTEISVFDAADRSFRVEIVLSGSAKVVYLFILETESYSAAG